ncbi:necrosis and ethylene inducing peptide [Geosmithia morbida]|uniref:Necrosis and ethylene inducing peptide n=1 Tax=Geosmithia morbida TaxID=1094350 RepID=A0A9P4YPU7_9HYPO|nr:necrosis and ethylene inducing peptide [Geosmithia morbida]KAF4120921.1 necrosis and ethylene inducing peptide [Geosmithia morbida]
MQTKSFLALALSLAIKATSAAPVETSPSSLQARDVINHDAVATFPETVQAGGFADVIQKFKPFLHIAHGCQSYPAVDADGNTSGGLQDTGSATGGCRDQSKGQTYVRAKTRGDQTAIMYAWYMPKDMPTTGVSTGSHRHDWENVVVFVDSAQNLVSAGASGHGEYKKTTTPQREGDRLKVEYFTNFPTNHELQFTDTLGNDIPLVDWDAIPQASRDGLSAADFGSATVPFKDDTFDGNLDKAAQ